MNVLEYIRLALAHRADPFYVKYLAGRRVLDVGAGEGDFVARDPARFVGIDIAPGLVEHCRARGLDVRLMSALRLDLPDQSFEAIHAAQVIEHFDSNDAAAFLQEMSRVLMPGGAIVLSTPGVRNVWDTFSHVRPYTPTALHKLLAKDTEGYVRDGSIDLVFEGAWGTRRYAANRTLFFLFGVLDFVFKPRNPIGWTMILRKGKR
jgi:ubiquinone/menaquinone biosynthesis C-methylase UbiE